MAQKWEKHSNSPNTVKYECYRKRLVEGTQNNGKAKYCKYESEQSNHCSIILYKQKIGIGLSSDRRFKASIFFHKKL